MQKHHSPTRSNPQCITRRQFVKETSTAAVAFSIAKPQTAFGWSANSKIRLGIIGCGGRGTWIANLFQRHGGYEIVAGADYFQDRVESFAKKFNLKSNRACAGLNCYKRLLELGVDAVAIESPPYFHPEQAAAAVDNGVHVYLAKPIAVDAPGCRSILESGKRASAKQRAFLIDFQTRANPLFQEAISRVHRGEIGEFTFGESVYHANDPFKSKYHYLEDDPSNAENRLRAWGLDRAISGDIITEQNIHTLDVASWIMNQEPLYAVGTGGRKARSLGNCYDHFALLIQYPNNVGITFSSRQFNGYGTSEGIRNRMIGTQGVLETEYSGEVIIRGETPYEGGTSSGLFQSGAVHNIAMFHEQITQSRFDNPTVDPSVQSNLLTIMGRTAALEERIVTWNETVNSKERLEARLKGLKG